MHYETKHVYIEIINYYLLTIFFVNQKYFIIYIHKRKWSLYNCLVKKIFKRIFFFFKCLKGAFWLHCWASHSICRWELQHGFEVLEKHLYEGKHLEVSYHSYQTELIQVQPRHWLVMLPWARKEKQWREQQKTSHSV